MDNATAQFKREYMREYMREYRKNNKEKIKEITERHWLNKAKKENFK